MVTENKYAPAKTRNKLNLLVEKFGALKSTKPGRAAARNNIMALINNDASLFLQQDCKYEKKIRIRLN